MFKLRANPIRWTWKITDAISDGLLWAGGVFCQLTNRLIDLEYSRYDPNHDGAPSPDELHLSGV